MRAPWRRVLAKTNARARRNNFLWGRLLTCGRLGAPSGPGLSRARRDAPGRLQLCRHVGQVVRGTLWVRRIGGALWAPPSATTQKCTAPSAACGHVGQVVNLRRIGGALWAPPSATTQKCTAPSAACRHVGQVVNLRRIGGALWAPPSATTQKCTAPSAACGHVGHVVNLRRIGGALWAPPSATTQKCTGPSAACGHVGQVVVGQAILPAAAFPGGSCGLVNPYNLCGIPGPGKTKWQGNRPVLSEISHARPAPAEIPRRPGLAGPQ